MASCEQCLVSGEGRGVRVSREVNGEQYMARDEGCIENNEQNLGII